MGGDCYVKGKILLCGEGWFFLVRMKKIYGKMFLRGLFGWSVDKEGKL